MKRYIITCIVALMGLLCAQAESISVGDVVMDKGETTSVAISLTNSHTDLVSFQMDLYLPDGISINKSECSLTNRFGSGEELTIGKQGDGAYRLTYTSLALTPISGTNGAIINLSLKASQTAMVTTANLKNIRFVTSSSERITIENVSFGISVRDNQSLSLTSLPSQAYGSTYSLPSETDQGLEITWTATSSSVATVSGNVLTAKGLGTTTIKATQAGNSTYRPFTKTYMLTVNKATLTIKANNASMIYGSEPPAFTATYEGFMNNETDDVLTTQPTFTCSGTSTSIIGTYDINVSGAVAQNYEISYVKGILTVNAKTVSNPTITLSQTSYTYDGNAKQPTVTVEDGSATIPASEYTVSYSNNTNVGTATVTITDKEGGNYTVSGNKTFSITEATLSGVAATSYEGTYDGAAHTISVTVPSGATIKYGTTEGTYNLTTAPTYTDVCNNTVYYKVTKSNYADVTGSATVKITAKTVSNPTITLSQTSYTYDGNAKQPTVTVEDGSATIPASEYTVSYSNNTNVGTATVTITDKEGGNYTVSGNKTFSITEATLSGVAATSYEGTYDGAAHTISVTVPSGATIKYGTTEGTYNLTTAPTYTDVCNNTVYYKVTKSNYADVTGSAMVKIMAKTVSNFIITLSQTSYTYDGKAQAPAVTVKDGSTTLTSGTDYTVAYSNNTNAGTSTVTVTGKGNYSGTKTANFAISKAQLTVTAKSYTITKGEALPTYEILYSGFVNNETASVLTTAPTANCTATSASAPGTYDITVSGGTATNYTFIYVKGTLTINAKSASNLTIEEISPVTYNGLAQTPTVTVKDGSTTLTSGTDYTVAYSNNTNAGTATVTITGKGIYSGTKTANFTINKAQLTVTAKSYIIEQDDPLPTFEAEFSGFKNNETSSVLIKQPSFNCSAVAGSEPGTYDIIVSGVEAENYSITYAKGTLIITQKDPVKVCDINGDGNLDDKDQNLIIRCIMNDVPEGFNKTRADVNNDGKVNAADVVFFNKIRMK